MVTFFAILLPPSCDPPRQHACIPGTATAGRLCARPMHDNPHFPHPFSPLNVGQRTLRNRVALAATLTNYGAAHRVTDRWTNFLAERTKGGCGMIVTEVIAVDPAALAHGAI